MEVAGRVEAVGNNVTKFRPGNDVFGWCNGAFAEYVSVSEDALAMKPSNITLEQAAAVPISAFAALQALRDADGYSRRTGLDHRCVWRRGNVCRADCQIVRSRGNRRL
jgi:NADPH:quinone reductase-like Zn-dependent oxidoreductase